MSYQSNQPGTKITLAEEIALAQLAALGDPGDVLTVNPSGTGLEYTPCHVGEFLEASKYDKDAIGGILISSHYLI